MAVQLLGQSSQFKPSLWTICDVDSFLQPTHPDHGGHEISIPPSPNIAPNAYSEQVVETGASDFEA